MADFPAENIRLWRDHDVVDSSGDKIGSLESVYFDTATDSATFATVQSASRQAASSSHR